MKKRTIYICVSILSFILMIGILNMSTNEDTSSYYYTYYDTPEIKKNYFTYKQSDYIESFFINCTVTNNQVTSLVLNNQEQPTFVYKNQNCWIYSLSSKDFVIQKGNTYYRTNRQQLEQLSKQLKNFSLDNLKEIK